MFRAKITKIGRITGGVLYGLVTQGEISRSMDEVMRCHMQTLADQKGFDLTEITFYSTKEGRHRFSLTTNQTIRASFGLARDDCFKSDFIERFKAFAFVQDVVEEPARLAAE